MKTTFSNKTTYLFNPFSVDTYSFLVNGEEEERIQKFLGEEHTFEEYCAVSIIELMNWWIKFSTYRFLGKQCLTVFSQYIERMRALSQELMGLSNVEYFDLIRLDTDDLKTGLAAEANGFADRLLERVASDHREDNRRSVLYRNRKKTESWWEVWFADF